MDFVELTGIFFALSPNARFIATRLDRVAQRRRSSVRVDVSDLFRSDSGVAHRDAHYAVRAVAIFSRRGDVIRVSATFRIPLFSARIRAPRFSAYSSDFQNQNARSFAHHESIAARIEGTAGAPGSSLRVESAFIAANPPMLIPVIGRFRAAANHRFRRRPAESA